MGRRGRPQPELTVRDDVLVVDAQSNNMASNMSQDPSASTSDIVKDTNVKTDRQLKTPGEILSELLCAPYNLKVLTDDEVHIVGDETAMDTILRKFPIKSEEQDHPWLCTIAAMQANQSISFARWTQIQSQYPPLVDLILSICAYPNASFAAFRRLCKFLYAVPIGALADVRAAVFHPSQGTSISRRSGSRLLLCLSVGGVSKQCARPLARDEGIGISIDMA